MDTIKALPISVTDLDAKIAVWPPDMFTGLNHPHLMFLLKAKDEPEVKVALEMCPHEALSLVMNLLLILADRFDFDPNQTFTLQAIASLAQRLNEELPSCSSENAISPAVKDVPSGEVN